MFCNCYNLKNLNLPSISNEIYTNNEFIFYGCGLNNLDLSNINWNKSDSKNNKYENEIHILIKAEKKDINKNLYFLNNTTLKELNVLNTKIYINNKKMSISIILYQKKKENII